MNERMALIWFSCFCCASEKLKIEIPEALAASLIELRVRGPPLALGADLREAERDRGGAARGLARRATDKDRQRHERRHCHNEGKHLLEHVNPPLDSSCWKFDHGHERASGLSVGTPPTLHWADRAIVTANYHDCQVLRKSS